MLVVVPVRHRFIQLMLTTLRRYLVLLGRGYVEVWLELRQCLLVANTPIEGFANFVRSRRSRCVYCGRRNRMEGSRYCSETCSAGAAEDQAIA